MADPNDLRQNVARPVVSEWHKNHGQMPAFAERKRVKVRLFNGRICGEEPVSPTTPAGWPAGGEGVRGACNWRISKPPHPFDIDEFWIL